jgi:teichuronic acid biosynthesis glycosyltransferase TuaG
MVKMDIICLQSIMNLVSIITPCYNAEKYLQQTYQSVSSQEHQKWEWIIVDDCSNDSSFAILQQFAKNDSRIKVFKNDKNSGAAITRNRCLEEANGDYVAFLDVDDLWAKEKLKKQIEFAQAKKAIFTYHDYQLIDPQGVFIKNQLCPKSLVAKDLLKFNPFATSSILIQRQLIESHSIRFKKHLRRRQDYLFWYEAIEACGKAYGMNDILSSYRLIGGDSLSANKKKMALIQWKLYRKEFKLSLFSSLYYFCFYAIHGLKKYFLK